MSSTCCLLASHFLSGRVSGLRQSLGSMEQHDETPHHELKGRMVGVAMILSSHIQWPGYKHREGASDLENQ